MKNTRKLCTAIFVVPALAWWLPAAAQENATAQDAIDCTVPAYAGEQFADVHEQARLTSRAVCQALIDMRFDVHEMDDDRIAADLAEFARQARTSLNQKNLDQTVNYSAQFEQLEQTFATFDSESIQLPQFIVDDTFEGGAEGYFTALNQSPPRFALDETGQCVDTAPGTSCRALFEDFAGAFNPYRAAYDRVYDNTRLLSTLGSRWDDFLEASKSQTALEVLLTTWVNRGHFKKDHLVGPPTTQVIALHPHIIYNAMNEASDDENLAAGLAVEWVGVNFWNWKIPFGVSLASVYVDREGVEDEGHGLMFHFDNRFSIGWADHDGDDSIYFTIDVLKLLESKQQKYDQYLGR